MKLQLFTLALIATSATFAQREVEVRYVSPEWDLYHTKPSTGKHTVSIYIAKGNNKRIDEQYTYNTNGLLESETSYKRFLHPKKETRYTYNDSAKITSRTILINNKFRSMSRFQYINQTLIQSSAYYYKDSARFNSITQYDYGTGNKTKSITGYNKHQNVNYRYEYTYDENGNRSESRYYKKEKLKHIWVYNCKAKGELAEPKTVKICKNRSYDADSSFTEIYESTSKGKVTRTIIKSAADGRVLEHEVINAKGISQSKLVYQYNESDKLVKRSRFKGKNHQLHLVELYEYNSDLSLITSIVLNKKGEVTSRREFSYN